MNGKITMILNPNDRNFKANIDELHAVDVYPKVYIVYTAHGKIIEARYFKHVVDDTYEFEHHVKPASVIDSVHVLLNIC